MKKYVFLFLATYLLSSALFAQDVRQMHAPLQMDNFLPSISPSTQTAPYDPHCYTSSDQKYLSTVKDGTAHELLPDVHADIKNLEVVKGYLQQNGSGLYLNKSPAKVLLSIRYCHLGDICRKEGNFQAAAAWYELGADLHCPASHYWLGIFFFEGTGVHKDEAKAAQHYASSCHAQNPIACLTLAILHATGLFIESSQEKALQFLQKAAAFGNPDAQKTCAELSLTY